MTATTRPVRVACATACALAALAFTSGAQAQMLPAAPDSANIVKFGGTYYDPHSKTDGIQGIGVPAGADAKVNGAATVLFTYERLILPNLGIEFAIGIPPKIKSDATGSVSFLGDDIVEARSNSPTLFLNYHFGSPGDRFRPYLGAGVNHTWFTGEKSRIADKVEIGSSTGYAFQGGLDYAITPSIGLFASVAHLKVKSKLVATGPTVLTTTIDFRPWVYSAGVSYRF